jgi:hypothetical protein
MLEATRTLTTNLDNRRLRITMDQETGNSQTSDLQMRKPCCLKNDSALSAASLVTLPPTALSQGVSHSQQASRRSYRDRKIHKLVTSKPKKKPKKKKEKRTGETLSLQESRLGGARVGSGRSLLLAV